MLETRMRDLRVDRDLSQEQVAAELGIHRRTYCHYENGDNAAPYEILVRLAVFYNTSTDYILMLTNEPAPYPRWKR